VKLLIKICGLTTPAAVDVAIAAGADALGFVFYGPSPRNLTPQRAAVLAARVPKRVRRVAVTLHPTQALVDAVLGAFMPDVWQTDAVEFATLTRPARIERWPVLRADQPLPADVPARFLFEGAKSGAGERSDWTAAAALARRGELVLGGGLDPGNVAAAVAAVRPYGVDVSSGVESASGVKDAGKIEAFVTAARSAARDIA
jgi:phosphoribosylanthranilate isomerase